MSDEITAAVAASMMVKCARRCCICRRFRPTKLQVHHIKERAQGGGNDEDNLIVVCFSCHSDVHTKVPFARRFSPEELKGHRDALVRMVEQGLLPTLDTDDADEVMATILRETHSKMKPMPALTPEAVELLLKAVSATGHHQGGVHMDRHLRGVTLMVGGAIHNIGDKEKRLQATYKHAAEQLAGCGLLERRAEGYWEVTYEGYLAADEISVARGQISTPGA